MPTVIIKSLKKVTDDLQQTLESKKQIEELVEDLNDSIKSTSNSYRAEELKKINTLKSYLPQIELNNQPEDKNLLQVPKVNSKRDKESL